MGIRYLTKNMKRSRKRGGKLRELESFVNEVVDGRRPFFILLFYYSYVDKCMITIMKRTMTPLRPLPQIQPHLLPQVRPRHMTTIMITTTRCPLVKCLK